MLQTELTVTLKKVGRQWVGTINGHPTIEVKATTKKACEALLNEEIQKVGLSWAKGEADKLIRDAIRKLK